MKKQITMGAVALLVLIMVGYGLGGITVIEPGEYGILVKQIGENRGMQEEGLGVGTRWVDPILYDVEVYDTRSKQYVLEPMGAATADGQPIALDVSFEIYLLDPLVPNLHDTVGHNWYQQVVYPDTRDAIRASTSGIPSGNIYTQEGRDAVRASIDNYMAPLKDRGIVVKTNLRDLRFTNKEFIKALEDKAVATEKEIIEKRLALAAIESANKVANVAEGEKQKVIKEAEAERMKMKLEGEGQRLRDEEKAKGILAIAKAQAEGTRLQVLAYGGGETYASVKWAESIGPKFQVWGVPTGAEGTSSIMDVSGILRNAFKGK